jgi:hypothetical protein
MVIVYQILRHILLRRAWQGGDSHPGRRGERRSALPIHQALFVSGTVLVIVQNHADSRTRAISSLKKLWEGASLVFLSLEKDLYPAWQSTVSSAFIWTCKRLPV